jgi:AcrR family transcriptional regulator
MAESKENPPSYPTISRRERKKRETRRRILEAALALMAKRPYAEVKIEEISAAADVANATFFLHFPTKASLITAFNEEVASKIADALSTFEGNAVAKLERLRTILLDEWRRHRNLMRQLVTEFVAQPASMAAFPEINQGLVELVADVIRAGQRSHEFDVRLDPFIVGLSLVSAWNAIAIGWAKTGDTEQATEANRLALDLVLRGVLRPKEAA